LPCRARSENGTSDSLSVAGGAEPRRGVILLTAPDAPERVGFGSHPDRDDRVVALPSRRSRRNAKNSDRERRVVTELKGCRCFCPIATELVTAPTPGGVAAFGDMRRCRRWELVAAFGRERWRRVAGTDDCCGRQVVRHGRLSSAAVDEAEQARCRLGASLLLYDWESISRGRPSRRRRGRGPGRPLQPRADAAVGRCRRDDSSSSGRQRRQR
jgi:hypothetical protein